ncbi:arginase family protein [Arthrobacter sp. NPDC080031]|uniref:arginase family protein n=1 Tax=Arthrobacter sp. NPDC080031 TaxID=3155918 RepID=UPI0034500D4D
MSPTRNSRVDLIGLPYFFGAPPQPNVYQNARGPHVLFADDAIPASLAEYFDDVRKVWIDDADEADERDHGGDVRLFPPGDQAVRTLVQNMRLAKAVHASVSDGRFPVASVGNCMYSLGMIGGLDDADLGMIWFDAHSDAATPETTSNGLLDGYPVKTITGEIFKRYRERIPGFHVIPADRVITVGDHERYSKKARAVAPGGEAVGRVVSPPEIAKAGFTAAVTEAVDELAGKVSRVFVHIDVDVLDDDVVTVSLHGAVGGLSPEQLLEAITIIRDRVEIAGLTIASYDPTLDSNSPALLTDLFTKVIAAAA